MTDMNEPVLSDDYPVYAGYLYVADGKVIESDITGDARRLKLYLNASEIRRCDIVARQNKARVEAPPPPTEAESKALASALVKARNKAGRPWRK